MQNERGNGTLMAAAVSVDITPPVGYELGGYGARKEPSNDVHDPLLGRLLLLDNGQTRSAVVTLDLLGLSWEHTQAIRKGVREAAGVPEVQTLVNWSHTHAGPDTRKYDCYLSQVVEKLAGAAQVALRELVPAEVFYAEDAIEFNVNRRRLSAEGKVIMAPNEAGVVDRRVRVLRFDTAEARPAAVVFHAVCHANALRSENLAISADFPGYAQELVSLAFGPGCTPMFMQGCTGNIRANLGGGDGFRSGDEEDLRWCGYSLGGAAVRAASRAGTLEGRAGGAVGSALGGAETVLDLQDYEGNPLPYPIQALRIGEVLIVALPGEPVVEYGLWLEERIEGWQQVLVAGYSNNGRAGYLATAEQYAEGGYEASPPASKLSAEAEPVVLEAAEAVAAQLL
ncbi:MAG: hypothetical protein HPY83_18230 [Anaerolineae bacterium]|nr:hypothetical protein [Anaerolineae bacterium]